LGEDDGMMGVCFIVLRFSGVGGVGVGVGVYKGRG
jgi:hypothetical protein